VRMLPILLAFLIIIGSLPLIAIVWGVRAAELGEVLASLANGVSFGTIHITAGDLLVFAVVFATGFVVTRWTQRIVQLSVFPALELERGVEAALLTVFGYAGLLLTLIVAVMTAGLDLSSLAIVAGALSVGAGLGLQSVVANFVSGVILLIERPIREGDWVEVAGFQGIVEKISVRSTRLRTLLQDDVIIPNSAIITGSVRNRTLADRSGRIDLEVGVAYDTDVARAFALVQEVARGCPPVRDTPAPIVMLERFDDSALVLRLICDVDEISQSALVKSQLRLGIFERFAAAGIRIPFPQREVTIVGGEPDRAAT